MKKTIMSLLMVVCAVVSATAQIGYQVTVFDEAKKAPKANQAVSATVTIYDNSGKVICTDNVSGTTDEFGILSMSVGNASTFSNVDWSKLPLWISATVDGVTISKTQILSVPVAEHAKHTGELTEDLLCSKTWICEEYYDEKIIKYSLIFSSDECIFDNNKTSERVTIKAKYIIDGNSILGYYISEWNSTYGDAYNTIPIENNSIEIHYIPAFICTIFKNQRFR